MGILGEKINKNNNIIRDKKECMSDYLEDKNIYNSDISSCSCNDMYCAQIINQAEFKEPLDLHDPTSIKIKNSGRDIPKLNDENVNVSIKEDQKRKEHGSKICDRNKSLGIILENIQVPQPPRKDEVKDDILIDQKNKINTSSDDKNNAFISDEDTKVKKSGDNEKSP